MDVVVPHTRSMADLLEVLDIIVADDEETRGDFWRAQPYVALPRASDLRPQSYPALAPHNAANAARHLAGKRFGVPRMYINADAAAGSNAQGGIGGATGKPIETRASIIKLWQKAKQDLEAAGAEVIAVDFPVISQYEADRPGASSIYTRGLVSTAFLDAEINALSAWAWDDFLKANGDPALNSLTQVDGATIFPRPPGALPDRYTGFPDDITTYPAQVRSKSYAQLTDIPELEQGLYGLEKTRRLDLEDWMDGLKLDAILFPAVADLGHADMDVDAAHADLGWRNGVWVANGNLAIRHLGIPTVTVPMGLADDINMPVGLTFAGRAYGDNQLLALAAAFELTGQRRVAPPRTPAL